MRLGKWRVFKPQNTNQLYDPTAYETDTVFVQSRQIVDSAMQRARSDGRGIEGNLARVKRASKTLKDSDSMDPATLLAKLILQTPGAVRAQRNIDKKFGGYLNRQARVYELIDFNDSFVDLILSLNDQQLVGFDERLRFEMDRFCDRVHALKFNDRELEAIIHGLSREIAVYKGAKAEGYFAKMTSRLQDAKGVDMIVTDPDTKKSIGIDIKTKSSYHWRLVRLFEKKAITEEAKDECEVDGYCRIHHSKDSHASTVLFRIDTREDHLGEIKNYRFTNTAPLGAKIARAMRDQGQYLVGST